jgi:RNA polymerase sigma-70 factor, ECF subfamily
LAIEARSGDEGAIGAFVAATQQDVWRFCTLMGRRGQADDLVQETYLRTLRSLPGFRAESSAKTWLLGIARRVCADDLRRNYRSHRLLERLVFDAPAFDHRHDQTSSGVDQLIASLEPERREAFVLTQVVELTYEEAAEAVGCPVGTIRSRVARARADLTEALRRAEAI